MRHDDSARWCMDHRHDERESSWSEIVVDPEMGRRKPVLRYDNRARWKLQLIVQVPDGAARASE